MLILLILGGGVGVQNWGKPAYIILARSLELEPFEFENTLMAADPYGQTS